MERGVAALAAMTGVLVVGLVGLAPALPAIVGHTWNEVPAVLLWSGVALILTAPLAVIAPGYLFAADEAGVVATATLVSAVAWFGVASALLPRYGAAAVGMGWVVAGIVNSGLLWRRIVAATGAAFARRLAGPTAVSLAGAVAGWAVAKEVQHGVLGGVLGCAAGELILLAGLAIVCRPALRDTSALVRQAAATFRPQPGAPAAAPLVGSQVK
jgi:hypothetical protein